MASWTSRGVQLRIVATGVAILVGASGPTLPDAAAKQLRGVESARFLYRTLVGCPHPLPLPGGAAAALGVANTMKRSVPQLYPDKKHRSYRIVVMGPLHKGDYLGQTMWRKIAVSRCGEGVADRSWFVGLQFPQLYYSADFSQGADYLSLTSRGWIIWLVFH